MSDPAAEDLDDLDRPTEAGGSFAGPGPRWEDLGEVERTAALAELAAWVEWLTGRYDLIDVPPLCWSKHGAVVEELSALRAAREAAYDPMAQPGDALAWHGQLAGSLDRISARWAPRCRGGEHREPVSRETSGAGSSTSTP